MAEDGYSKFLSYLQNAEDTTTESYSSTGTSKHNIVENGSVQILSPDEEDADAPTTYTRSKLNISSRRKQLSRRASTTEERRNPFAEREGNALIWRNVNMTLSTKQGEKKLLNDVWGEVPPGEITAIMGPSGAGKSSLLNVLAGRSRSTAKLNVQSEIRMNEYLVDPTNIEVRKQIAFVAQDDSLSFTATPREAIRFSAKLRLPRITTDNEIEELADRMLAELGLKDCADTMIGGSLIKGISGGERKRTSVGVELVTKPSLVFLDGETFCMSLSCVCFQKN
jgi:ABC-type lipoprotein export system ATPase subunit